MRKSHRLLLRLYHDPGYDFSRVSIEYVNRGSPQDRSTARGDQILRLDAQYVEVDAGTHTACIPYHRLTRIFYRDAIVWERGERSRDGKTS
jgi:uncharacterized protein